MTSVIRDVRRIVEGIADRIAIGATSEAIFGQPIQQKDITVIPVGKLQYGFGGGGGRNHDDGGAGGGGGVRLTPLGYIEIARGRSIFRRFSNVGRIAQLVMSAGALLFLWRARKQS